MSPVSFPKRYQTRPATKGDANIITDLYRIVEQADFGAPEISLGDIEASLNFPQFDLDEQTILIFDRDRLVGYAEAFGWRADVAIHPEWRGRGLGSAILDWTEATTVAQTGPGEEARIGQTVIDTCDEAIALLTNNGYEYRHTSWVLRLPGQVALDPKPLPNGYEIVRGDVDTQAKDVFRVIEDAFNEWPNRTPSTFDKWRAWTIDRPDFDPSLLFVALHDARVVGAAVGLSYPEEGWIHQIAVEKSHRGKGLAKALLSRTFSEMRSGGAPQVGLSTDSRTGALDLYLALGMVVRKSFTHYSKLLRPATEVQP